MNPATILSAANAALALVEAALPAIQSAVQSGQISVGDQQVLLNTYNSLVAKANGQFSGPEWQIGS